ncbi:MAG: TIGR02302 family protein [Pseudomonadota bacterium]
MREGRIRSAVRRAWLALLWENIWPSVALVLGVVALYCILSWFGLFSVLPAVARYTLLVVLALGLVSAVVLAVRTRLPNRDEAMRRVEQESHIAHRPLTTLSEDAFDKRNSLSTALWRAHQERVSSGLKRLAGVWPSPKLARRDPYALRALLILGFVVSFVYAGPDRWQRLGDAFAPAPPALAADARLDAWISPPTYTGRAPRLLTHEGTDVTAAIDVPRGSVLIVRGDADSELSLSLTDAAGSDNPVSPDGGLEAANDGRAVATFTVPLETDTIATVRRDDGAVSWQFAVLDDTVPTITFERDPEITETGQFRLSYQISDDYGVVLAEARLTTAISRDNDADPLVEPPTIALGLPELRARAGSAQTTRDLSQHPWAGADVWVTLAATDDPGQTGLSNPVKTTLPQRVFRDPLARALIEQRRELAMDRNVAPLVERALDTLTIAPDRYFDDDEMDIFLGIRSAYHRLRSAEDGEPGDPDRLSVLDQLWTIALAIEDGDLSDIMRQLRQAQQELRQAIEDGAPQDEIDRMMAELRQALNEFLAEMAQRAMENQSGETAEIQPDQQIVTDQDLNDMLDAIENLLRSGANDAAEELLSQLQNMLEQLRNAETAQQMDGAGEMGQAMNELGDMIRRQQELMDETFQLDQSNPGQQGQQNQPGQQGQQQQGQNGQQGQPGQPGQGMTPEQLAEALEQLQQGQSMLREQLEALMDQLGEMGVGETESFGEAGTAMGDAEGDLGQGDTGEALADQGRALDQLRQGAQSMAEQFAQQFGGNAPSQAQTQLDPLGRPMRTEGPDFGESVEVPDEIDARRAREILEELRRRLSDPNRPQLELDYLERLLPN